MKYLKLLLSATVTLLLFYLGHTRVGSLPPLGKFLSPFSGFWQNNRHLDALPETLTLPELQEPVQVLWDDRHVPHIFAANDHDLYYVQGYLTARDRLWQMDFLSRAAAGRLSEVMGERTLEYDRFRRRIGMLYAAEQSVQAMSQNDTARAVIEAYTAGVNAWIEQLEEKHLPLEFKLLDYRPEPWTPLKSALILKYMSWILTGRFNEVLMTRTRSVLGEQVVDQLYPYYPPLTDPIIPPGTPWPFAPRAPQPPAVQFYPTAQSAPMDEALFIPGSNNWAVAGSRTIDGYAILCSDPHLALNLPSIWYEIQLRGPGHNAYGVTIPGTPAIIIGFNEHIAWGMTNAISDVLDWYVLTFSGNDYSRYRYGDGWRNTSIRIEEIRIRGGRTVIDTVYYTHYGPIPYRKGEKPFFPNFPVDAAMRWTAHDPSREMLTFLGLNRAKGYDDYVRALSYFDNPAQNIAYADIEGNIAIRHNGKFPLRWKGQGRYLLDGSNPEHEWQGWIPRDEIPQVKNPPRGFISSANQAPVDPSYPYYLGWNYATSERGTRINEWLRAHDRLTPKDMMTLQLDNLNVQARTLLPVVLPLIDESRLDAVAKIALDTLKAWNYLNRSELTAPTIFKAFWRNLYTRIWNDDISHEKGPLLRPRRDVTLELILNHPESEYFDDRTTTARESLHHLVQQAFEEAVSSLVEKHGPIGPAWAWGSARGTDIRHLLRLPGLGRYRLQTSGDFAIVNATTGMSGPSWRMVVQLKPGDIRAWGHYPGGQSGNPGSAYYDNMIDDWVAGRYYELAFLKSPDESNKHIIARTLISR